MGKCEGTENKRGMAANDNNCSQVSHQCAPGGLFIGVVTGGYYNVHKALVHLP
jgi:hypothetical protein